MRFVDITSRSDFCHAIGIKPQLLTYVLYKFGVENSYSTFEILKKNGKKREINAPNNRLKAIQTALANCLWDELIQIRNERQIKNCISFAFEKRTDRHTERNNKFEVKKEKKNKHIESPIISNAIIHRNKKFVLNIDLESFFDSFHFGRVRGFFEKNRDFKVPIEIATIIAQISCYKGRLPQGAPSSPILTNLICQTLDYRILRLAKKYKLDYTRYADDLTFSTNRKDFCEEYDGFIKEVEIVITKAGFQINKEKTRLQYHDSRQTVTGLVVNKKINIDNNYYRQTRALADSYYRNGKAHLEGKEISMNVIEGRFSFINHITLYNSKGKLSKSANVTGRDFQFRKFLFYKYFFANETPLIVTEGKTDSRYIKAALKKMHKSYPLLVEYDKGSFKYHISFFNRSKRIEQLFIVPEDGGDGLRKISNLYHDKQKNPEDELRLNGNSLMEHFKLISEEKRPRNPVFLLFDNEMHTDKPLKIFLSNKKDTGIKERLVSALVAPVCENLFLLTIPLVNDRTECEIEDLFDESILNTKIQGKTFSKSDKYDKKSEYGKDVFSKYILKKHENINFDNFKPMFDALQQSITEWNEGR